MTAQRPNLTVRLVVLVVAVVIFALAFFGVEPWAGHSLVDAGLAFFALAFIV